jgi:hypothetical protein
MLGWIAESSNDNALRYLHLRPMGSSEKGILVGRKREGYGQYFMGSHPLYMLARTVSRLPTHPAVIGAVITLWSYVYSGLSGARRYDNVEFRRFVRRYQRDCLWLGKARALRVHNERQAAVWHAMHPSGDK